MRYIGSHFEGNSEVGDTFLSCGTSGISGRNIQVALTPQQMIGMLRKLRANVIRRCGIQI